MKPRLFEAGTRPVFAPSAVGDPHASVTRAQLLQAALPPKPTYPRCFGALCGHPPPLPTTPSDAASPQTLFAGSAELTISSKVLSIFETKFIQFLEQYKTSLSNSNIHLSSERARTKSFKS
jgi:hypothetical protein